MIFLKRETFQSSKVNRWSMFTKIVLFLISTYKKFLSPFLETIFGKACRFNPTCSEYAHQSISKFGIIKGGKLSLKRLVKCQPFSE